MPPILVDTNVLLYSYDGRDAEKQLRAQEVLARLYDTQAGVMSVQALSAFMNSARKIGISPEDAQLFVTGFAATWRIIGLTPAVITEAARGLRDHSLAYYDAQVWAVAKLHQIPAIFSEDFNSGSSLEGVRFVNPFAPTFRLGDWV
jgi:predicted nucleic acid-binding protein